MILTRRRFLLGIGATAPALVMPQNIMRIAAPKIIKPTIVDLEGIAPLPSGDYNMKMLRHAFNYSVGVMKLEADISTEEGVELHRRIVTYIKQEK